jgi:hypothetical protein
VATIGRFVSVHRERGSMGWAQATALIVAVITVVGAVVTGAVTYGLNQRAGRRERQARAFAEALTAIEEYAMMPYRIRRRHNTPEARNEISVELDKIQSGLRFSTPGSRSKRRRLPLPMTSWSARPGVRPGNR